jgi:hypothetical protein
MLYGTCLISCAIFISGDFAKLKNSSASAQASAPAKQSKPVKKKAIPQIKIIGAFSGETHVLIHMRYALGGIIRS